MNHERLQKVFRNYIRKFEFINDDDHNENFKWEAAAVFRDLMDTKSDDFVHNIKEAVRETSVLIDGQNHYCFSALAKCAETHTEEVKALFNALFAEDGGDLVVRQNKILSFIEDANKLVSRVYTSNGMYMNDQRSAMAYLFLYDPEHNFLYKYSEAKDFAACIQYYGDWGSGLDFHLDVYYRMCELLVREIRNTPELIEKHKKRYWKEYGNRAKHPDQNFHILAFDIIYGAPDSRYNFYDGMKFPPITAEDYKKAMIAQKLYEELEIYQRKVDTLEEGIAYFNHIFCVGKKVKDKFNNEGTIIKVDQFCVHVNFPEQNVTKAYIWMKAFFDKMLITDDPDLEEMLVKYRDVIPFASIIRGDLKKAKVKLAPYVIYLEQ